MLDAAGGVDDASESENELVVQVWDHDNDAGAGGGSDEFLGRLVLRGRGSAALPDAGALSRLPLVKDPALSSRFVGGTLLLRFRYDK